MTEPGLTFNEVATDYDRYRGAYPAEFIKMALEVRGDKPIATVCEIGSGSGQATIRLAELGYSITCVEPGSELLELGRIRLKEYSKVSFIPSKFETANLPLENFDLVFAANSLHWVAAGDRYQKPLNILRPGGHLIAVWRWNHPLSGALGENINKIFRDRVPAMGLETRSEYEQGALSHFNDLVASGLYWQSQVRRISYQWDKPSEDYVRWIGTWSQLAVLADKERFEVCRLVKEEIDAAGGKIFESGETVIVSAQKPDSMKQ